MYVIFLKWEHPIIRYLEAPEDYARGWFLLFKAINNTFHLLKAREKGRSVPYKSLPRVCWDTNSATIYGYVYVYVYLYLYVYVYVYVHV